MQIDIENLNCRILKELFDKLNLSLLALFILSFLTTIVYLEFFSFKSVFFWELIVLITLMLRYIQKKIFFQKKCDERRYKIHIKLFSLLTFLTAIEITSLAYFFNTENDIM